MNRLADARISSAPADRGGHHLVDCFVIWIFVCAQKGAGIENHPGLTKSALRDILFEPGPLAGMIRISGKAFNCRERTIGRVARGKLTGAESFAVFEHGAGAADSNPATVFGSSQA